MKKSNDNNSTGTVIKNHQINNFIKELSGVMSEHREEFLSVNIQSSELIVIVGDYDFFSIGHIDGKLKITIKKDFSENIKLKIFQLFDDIFGQ